MTKQWSLPEIQHPTAPSSLGFFFLLAYRAIRNPITLVIIAMVIVVMVIIVIVIIAMVIIVMVIIAMRSEREAKNRLLLDLCARNILPGPSIDF